MKELGDCRNIPIALIDGLLKTPFPIWSMVAAQWTRLPLSLRLKLLLSKFAEQLCLSDTLK